MDTIENQGHPTLRSVGVTFELLYAPPASALAGCMRSMLAWATGFGRDADWSSPEIAGGCRGDSARDPNPISGLNAPEVGP